MTEANIEFSPPEQHPCLPQEIHPGSSTGRTKVRFHNANINDGKPSRGPLGANSDDLGIRWTIVTLATG